MASVPGLAGSLRGCCGVELSVLAPKDEYSSVDLALWTPLEPRLFPVRGPRFFGYTPLMRQAVYEAKPDIIHTHGLWKYPTVAALSWSRRSNGPYLVSSHGMLDYWAVRHSRWKKFLAGAFYVNRHLRHATCIHSLCAGETRAIRDYGLINPICQIPNGIDAPGNLSGNQEIKEAKTLLYLGRIHPKKGLISLLRAWEKFIRQRRSIKNKWEIAIVGWDQNGHEDELKVLAKDLGVTDSVHFLGPRFGEDKAAAYRNSDAFILPSLSEGLPMVILEAWAYHLPVLMTPECNLPEGFKHDAGIRIETTIDSIASGIETLVSLSEAERKAMGSRGRKLVEDTFQWPKIGENMHKVYEWILGGGPPPSCVITD